jgi:trimethylamine--corrinoid protein Co-methyltransferase
MAAFHYLASRRWRAITSARLRLRRALTFSTSRAAMSVVLGPEVMVLGGASAWKGLPLVAATKQQAGTALSRPVPLRPTSLGRDVVVLGQAARPKSQTARLGAGPFAENPMSHPHVTLLSPEDIRSIHETSLQTLSTVGVRVPHASVIERLKEAGAVVDLASRRVRFPEEFVLAAVERAARKYVLHGRQGERTARFGYGDLNLISSPGQFAWFDHSTRERRESSLHDTRQAIKVGDALQNITVVGAMTVPSDVPAAIRDVILTAELVRGTLKPTRCWPVTRESSEYVLEIYKTIAGGKEALRTRPMVEVFLEPISPLQFPQTGLDVMLPYLDHGQPVSIGPMVMASGTGPATLAGTIALENAEILAGIAIVQTLAPGTPVLYGGIPHVLDPRTAICAFGSAEQGLMAVAMSELGHFYGFPVYLNVNLTDAKLPDVQAGMEKMGSLILGMLAGADIFGHAGIVGTDHGGSLEWLIVDDEAMSYARRVVRGFAVNQDTLAADVVSRVGPGGNFMSEDHTLEHFRE